MSKKLLFTLLLIAFSLCGYSQTTAKKQNPKDPVSAEERYNKLKEYSIKEMDSKTHIAADSLFQVFIYKITPDMELSAISKEVEDPEDYVKWAKENLSKTEFKTEAEAEKLWAEYMQATTASIEENQAFYDYMMEMYHYEGGIDIHLKVMNDLAELSLEKHRSIKLPERKKKSEFYPKLPGQ